MLQVIQASILNQHLKEYGLEHLSYSKIFACPDCSGPVREWVCHRKPVKCVHVNPVDSNYIATASGDGWAPLSPSSSSPPSLRQLLSFHLLLSHYSPSLFPSSVLFSSSSLFLPLLSPSSSSLFLPLLSPSSSSSLPSSLPPPLSSFLFSLPPYLSVPSFPLSHSHPLIYLVMSELYLTVAYDMVSTAQPLYGIAETSRGTTPVSSALPQVAPSHRPTSHP